MGFFQDPAGATTAFFNNPGSATSGNIVPGLDNPFQSGKTVWLPGAGGLNPLNSQSAVGQLTKDVGQLNPFNPDSTAGKVVNNIGADMAKNPVKWVAIAACIAAGPAGWKMIPYVNAVAALTSKNSTPEEWLTEGAKAYIISAGGEYVANNVTGVGPQTDITTGETFAGTGATGAMGSAKAGAVAGNISRNIFATAARKGNTDINSAQIVTGALTNEALNEAFKTMPGFDGLTRDEQSATVSAFKAAFNKDSNAAYQLFNQGFDATIKGLNQAAGYAGYKDLNEQNAVNNFVMAGSSNEDIDALTQREKSSERAAQEAEEQAKRVADFGKNLTGGGGQDLGPVDTNTDFYDKDSSGMGAYKYDPTSGTYTYTSDDGSTLTLDGDGNITGVTEATDTSWAKLTDAKTGSIKLPKLPSGKTPVTPPTKPPVTLPAQPDPLASLLSQQQTPVTYQTVMPELAKVFYGGKDFSSAPQKLNEQGQLVQKNPLLGGAKPQTASPLALQDGSEENDVTKLLSQILGTEGNQNSQQDFMNYFGKV